MTLPNQEQPTFMDEADISDSYSMSEYNIAMSSNDFNSMTIGSYMESGVIKLPFFQRNFIWDRARASKLIESLMLGLPVPQIFLYEQSKNNFLILDGQQRLFSIFFFIKGRFPKKAGIPIIRESYLKEGKLKSEIIGDDSLFENFNLKLNNNQNGQTSRLNGLNYETLEDLKLNFDLRPIRCITLKQNEPRDDDSSMYEIFDRLNTGGVNLLPQEIRANLYHSTFYTHLYQWNKIKEWRVLLGAPNEDYRMRDVELLLRALALSIDSKKYKPSMASFLNAFSREKRSLSEDEVKLYDKVIRKFFALNADIPRDSLLRGNVFSVAKFEAIFVFSCAQAIFEGDADKVKKVKSSSALALSTDSKFSGWVQEGTTKKENVQSRLSRAGEVLEAE